MNERKTTTCLKPSHVRKLVRAADASLQIGRGLNYHVTISFRSTWPTPIPNDVMTPLLKRLGDHIRRKGKAVWLWVAEYESAAHVHLLLHLPLGMSEKELISLLKSWLEMQSVLVRRDTVKIRMVYFWDSDRLKYVRSLGGILRYILKGADPSLSNYLGVAGRYKTDQGEGIGKRYGISQSISVAVQQDLYSGQNSLMSGYKSRSHTRRRIFDMPAKFDHTEGIAGWVEHITDRGEDPFYDLISNARGVA